MDHHNRPRHSRRNFPNGIALDVAWVIVAVSVYCTNTWFIKSVTRDVFVHRYLNDLFAMPCLLGYSNLLIRACRRPNLVIAAPIPLLFLTLVCVLAWEVLAPILVSNSVADAFDVVAYCAGTLLYFATLKIARQ